MASLFKKGDNVEVRITTPKGSIESIRMDDEGVVWYLISWIDSDNQSQHRWFPEEQLQLTAA